MADLSNYAEDKLLDHILGTAAYTMPTNVYIALYTVAPTDAGGGTEVVGGSYARKVAAFSASSGGTTSNTADIDFTNMPAVTVVAAGIFDAVSGGNLLWHGNLASSKSVDAGDTLRLATGDIDVTLA